MSSSAPAAGSGWLELVRWGPDGLVPVIAQDAATGRVLMCAWADRSALAETAASGKAVYWSRSRARRWMKGEESGHIQHVREIRLDCDADVVLLAIDQEGGIACHTGRQSCFFKVLREGVWVDIDPVLKDPASIYASGSSHGSGHAVGHGETGS